jgi:aminoglycoside phosphotransferase (APT) family kinase protein
MTLHAPLSTDLRQWVTHQLPDLATVVDVSWPHGCSRVWRMASGTDEVYVKLSPTLEDYAREVHAYEHAARIAPHEVPRMLATDPGLRAIMTSPLSGLVVRGLCLTAGVESRVHELAGRLLRRWHDLPEPASGRARKVIKASVAEQADEAAACLERTAEHLTDAQRALVAQVSRELPRLAEDLPVVFRHGDYSPHNWLWDAEHGTHGLIDFEQSDHGVAVEDFVWLRGALWPTPGPQDGLPRRLRTQALRRRAADFAPAHRAAGRFLPQLGHHQAGARARRARPNRPHAPGGRLRVTARSACSPEAPGPEHQAPGEGVR